MQTLIDTHIQHALHAPTQIEQTKAEARLLGLQRARQEAAAAAAEERRRAAALEGDVERLKQEKQRSARPHSQPCLPCT